MPESIAVFYQKEKPPVMGNVKKPYKEGGYSDSGADIAFTLKENQIRVLTPNNIPSEENVFDWVFPDTLSGMKEAYDKGARVFWMNTVLYQTHPISQLSFKNLKIVGQDPAVAEKYDDKFFANTFLKTKGLSIANSSLIKAFQEGLSYPFVLKPVRGRGSQGVVVIENEKSLKETIQGYLQQDLYGSEFIIEELLPGEEITITVLPKGEYIIKGKTHYFENAWSLPPVRRLNHHKGIAPYNGVVAVSQNSVVLEKSEISELAVSKVMQECALAFEFIGAKAPIRIDCRKDAKGEYKIFDLNLKPNMTGAGRKGREDQDSLCLIAAKGIGWSYSELLKNILNQAWDYSNLDTFPLT